jgi:hypothetical protein
MSKPLKQSDYLSICRAFEIGFLSGKDWLSILKWVSKNHSQKRIRVYLFKLCSNFKIYSAEKVLANERKKIGDPSLQLFYDIVLQINKGFHHPSQLITTYAQLLQSTEKLKKKQKSLLFIPRFQAAVALTITLIFTVALPALYPNFFKSFALVNRYDLLIIGYSLLFSGFLLLYWLCNRPKKYLQPLFSKTFFFYYISIFIQTGLDFTTAWSKAVSSVPFSKALLSKLTRKDLNIETMDEYLWSLQKTLDSNWSDIITGLLWAKETGAGLSNFLQQVSREESERILWLWETEMQKLSLISLIPLYLIIFPSTLFLLLGPQLMEVFSL